MVPRGGKADLERICGRYFLLRSNVGAQRKTMKSGEVDLSGGAMASAPAELSLRDRIGIWRRRIGTIFIGLLALVMGYGVVFGHNGLTAFAHKREEARLLSVQTQQLQRENERLRGHVDRLQSDPAAIEHEAREDLHYTRAGEVIITLPKTPSSPVAAPKGR
jgi:cell division protein FtsB